jgi:hypothetical protein
VIGCFVAWAAPAADLFTGIWVLNAGASTYATGDMPQSMTIRLDATEQGEHYFSRAVRKNRQKATAEYSADYNGTLAMVVGDSGLLTPVSLRRTDPNTVEVTYQRAFRTIAHTVRVVSPDARTMTITTTVNGEPKERVNIGIFSKCVEPSECDIE